MAFIYVSYTKDDDVRLHNIATQHSKSGIINWAQGFTSITNKLENVAAHTTEYTHHDDGF
jgi:hypothetical protein